MTDRKILREIQNVSAKPPSAGPTKPSLPRGKTKLSNSRPPSNIPRPSRRHTQSAVSDNPPVPTRLNAEPRRGPGYGVRSGIEKTKPTLDRSRRRATNHNMTFTQGTATTRFGARPNNEAKSSDGQIVEIMKTFQDSQEKREDKLYKMGGEIIELNKKLMEVENEKRDFEMKFVKEKQKTGDLTRDMQQMKHLLQSRDSHEQVDNQLVLQGKEKIAHLEGKLKEAEDQRDALENEKVKLQKKITDLQNTNEDLENEAGTYGSKIKDLQRRLQITETEVTNAETEVRKIRREKERVEDERNELEETLKKRKSELQKTTSELEEEREKCQQLSKKMKLAETDFEMRNKHLHEEMMTMKTGATARVDVLQDELDQTKKECKQYCKDLSDRARELELMKETVTLQENNKAKYKVEKMALDAKIEALNGQVADKTHELQKLLEENKAQLEQIRTLEEQAREDASMRRKLHNAIQELKGNIRVFCRVRPLLTSEINSPQGTYAKQMFEYNEKGQGLIARMQMDTKSNHAGYRFKFDKVFGPQANQAEVFDEISQLVQSALDGYRVCIFAYGQTGSGKTHTMLGNRGNGDADLGMIPRSVRQVFHTAKQLEKDQWKFKLKASFLEIYNENVRDLLVDTASPIEARGRTEKHRIVFNADTKLSSVSDLTIVDVGSEEHVQRLVSKSIRNRATAATKANDQSSRSHSVFRLYIEGSNAVTGQQLNGLLNLIDLAGSERLSQSKAEGSRLRETKHINKSLSALGDVIAALANKEKHIPFRNSKLTYLLQDSLGGDSKTLMFVNLSHALESFNESLCSLRFAAKVNSCHVGTASRTAKIQF